jgi:drug/metabolite transporter (DMT)-like permease
LLPIIYGLLSAFTWGAGDFTGGFAARKAGAYRTVFYAEVIGVVVLGVAIIVFGEMFPGNRVWYLSMIAGAMGTIGLMLLYHSMTLGLMSIAAPVSALLSAALPVVVGIFIEGWPEYLTFIGFGFALLAVWMVSQSGGKRVNIFSHLADLKLPLLAGIGFGCYFIFMHEATSTETVVLWPMLASRCGGLILITLYILFTRTSWKVTDSSAWPVIFLNGILDISGNLFFILASQAGRLDVAAVLSSLFPGATVLLAWIFLKERLTRFQWIGIISALIAIILMTI